MVYRFQLKRSPKSLVLPGIAAALVAGSVAIIVFYHALLGIAALAVSGFISYHLVKFFVNTLKSNIRTSEEGVVCATAMGSESTMSWNDVTHAGWYTTDSGYRELFIYAESHDQLLTIPAQYESMDDLAAEIGEHGNSLMSLTGEEVDGLADALREHLVPESEIIDDEAEADED